MSALIILGLIWFLACLAYSLFGGFLFESHTIFQAIYYLLLSLPGLIVMVSGIVAKYLNPSIAREEQVGGRYTKKTIVRHIPLTQLLLTFLQKPKGG